MFGNLVSYTRWCKEVCAVHPSPVDIPLSVTNVNGDEAEQMVSTAVIWPWDYFSHLWESGKFLQWITEAGLI